MQLKFVALSTALVASVYASPAADVTIPTTDLPIIESALPSSAKAYILSHGYKSFSQKVASEVEAGKTPGWFTKLPSSIETLLIPQNATTAASNNTTAHGNHTTTKAHSGHHSDHSHHSTPLLTTGPGPVSIRSTTSPSNTSPTSATSSTTNGAVVASAVFGAGLAGAVGLMGVLAL